ncbi:secreted protein [Apostichopus japonicus]|uniref:Secreted protein n=1 Tax=Stichopus japonicus TaxID=307972 RepID=A0A2G8K0A6_STIJA|nr:secreted protein [Apostichopus japonicus]
MFRSLNTFMAMLLMMWGIIGNTSAKPLIDDCNMVCLEVYIPVCGSDGKIYNNGCFLNLAQCKDDSLEEEEDEFCGLTCKGRLSPYLFGVASDDRGMAYVTSSPEDRDAVHPLKPFIMIIK